MDALIFGELRLDSDKIGYVVLNKAKVRLVLYFDTFT